MSGLEGRLPFSLDDASRAEAEKDENPDAQFNRVLLDTRLNNRVIDLRVCYFTVLCAWARLTRWEVDPDESGHLQATICHWDLLQGVFGLARLHRDPQSQVARGCNRVWGICLQSQLFQRSVISTLQTSALMWTPFSRQRVPRTISTTRQTDGHCG